MIAAYSLPRLKAMGLKLYGFLGNVGGQGSIAAAMKRRTDFFAEAIAFAKQNQYDGYSSGKIVMLSRFVEVAVR